MSVQSVTPASNQVVAPNAPPAATVPPAAPVDPAAKKPGEVDIKPEELRTWSTLQRKAREAEAKASAAEARAAELETKSKAPVEVKTLARARELGIPLEELFQEWVAEGQAGTGPVADSEARAKLEALEKRVNDEAEARGKETEAQRTARYEASIKATDGLLVELLDEAPTDGSPMPWKLAARKENRGEAVTEARKLVQAAVMALQEADPNAPITDEHGEKLMRLALDEVEADFVERGKRYAPEGTTGAVSTAPTPRTAPVARTTISNDRGTLRRPPAETPAYTTYAAAKAEVMQRIRSRRT